MALNKSNLSTLTSGISDPHNLKLQTRVNGVVKQDSNTNQLVFKTQELVAFISRSVGELE